MCSFWVVLLFRRVERPCRQLRTGPPAASLPLVRMPFVEEQIRRRRLMEIKDDDNMTTSPQTHANVRLRAIILPSRPEPCNYRSSIIWRHCPRSARAVAAPRRQLRLANGLLSRTPRFSFFSPALRASLAKKPPNPSLSKLCYCLPNHQSCPVLADARHRNGNHNRWNRCGKVTFLAPRRLATLCANDSGYSD